MRLNMNIVLKYTFPIAAALLLIAFYTGLPSIKSCRLSSYGDRSFGFIDISLAAAATIIYAFVAFTNLGNTVSPQSFQYMGSSSAVFETESAEVPVKLVLYTGVGMGSYTAEYSDDGVNFDELCVFTQNHVENLKWEFIDLDIEESHRFIRVTGSGELYLGEFAIIDRHGEPIPLHSDTIKLCDEQNLVPAQQDFMNSTYFDEIYHARTAWENINGVDPYEVSHPPLGKLIITLGIRLFGMTPFGWRFMGVLFGTLMLPLMYIFSKKLFGGIAVPFSCTLVFASDFMHFVQTRIATIDTYAVFFIILMYLFMYLFIESKKNLYLALSGLFFGIGAASKWTCIYAGAGLAVIWILHWVSAFLSAKKDCSDVFKAFIRNCLLCLVFFVVVPCLFYYVSYYPYGIARGMKGIGMYFTQDYLQLVLDNQSFMFSYHSKLVAEHPYSSSWYQWVFNIRPILYYLKYFSDGLRSSIAAFVNPALCWGGLLALFVLLYTAAFRRDRNALFIIIGFLAQLVPWMFVDRITFEYHYFPSTVFLILALGYIFRLMELNVPHWRAFVYGFVIMSIGLFVLFYPALSGAIVDNKMASRFLGWLPTWPLFRLFL